MTKHEAIREAFKIISKIRADKLTENNFEENNETLRLEELALKLCSIEWEFKTITVGDIILQRGQ